MGDVHFQSGKRVLRRFPRDFRVQCSTTTKPNRIGMAAYHVQDDPRRQRVGFGFLIFMIFMIIAIAFLHFRKRKNTETNPSLILFRNPLWRTLQAVKNMKSGEDKPKLVTSELIKKMETERAFLRRSYSGSCASKLEVGRIAVGVTFLCSA